MTSPTAPADLSEFQAFLAWKNGGSPATGYLPPERAIPSIGEVLKLVVNRVNLPSEQAVNDCHTAIDRFVEAIDELGKNQTPVAATVEATTVPDPAV